jgi:biopolymer transport protein ExbB
MILDYFQKGGMLMYPLLLCSLFALTLIMERFFYYRKFKINLGSWFDDLIKKPDQINQKLQNYPHPVSRVLEEINQNQESDKKDLEIIAQESAEKELQKLQRNLKPLGVIATLAPLIGLLGTVMGIMKAFLKTAESGKVDPTLLAGGIWEALITTCAGLIIAIPCWAFYYYFESRVDRLTFLMEYFSSRFLRFLKVKI